LGHREPVELLAQLRGLRPELAERRVGLSWRHRDQREEHGQDHGRDDGQTRPGGDGRAGTRTLP
jgi:hypothetical protein